MTKPILKILLPFIVLASACTGPEEQNATVEVKSVNVETVTISPKDFTSHIRLIGTVGTSNDVLLSAEVSGTVVEHRVDEGDQVKQGEIILKIDDSKLLQEKKRLEALTELSRINYERLEKLYEEEQIGSEIEYLNAKYAYEQNKSALASIKIDIKNTNITAPFDAIIEDILLEEGEMATPGAQIVRLIGSGKFKITAGVPARYAGTVNEGDAIKIWFDTQQPDTIDAEIKFAARSINPQNRTFMIEIDLPQDHNATYKVDMIANLELTTLTENNVIVISEEYLYREKEDYIVYVASKNENDITVAEKKSVRPGPTFQSNVIIREGLDVGDQFITIGSAFLSDGMRLNIVSDASNTMTSLRK